MSHMQVFDWHKRFSTGRDDVGDDPKSGRPSTSRIETNIEKVKRLIRCDRKLTIRMMTEQLGLAPEITTISQHSTSTRKSWDASAHESATSGGISGKSRTGCCITTMRPHILPSVSSSSCSS